MSVINNIDRKTFRGRLAIALVYLLLIAGGITMVYPFLLMLVISVSNEADNKVGSLWPRYLSDDEALHKKYVATKYSGFQRWLGARHLNRHYLSNYYKFEDLGDPNLRIMTVEAAADGSLQAVPADLKKPAHLQRARDWHQFIPTLPPAHVTRSCEAWLLDRYQDWLHERFHGNIGALQHAYRESAVNFLQVQIPFHDPYMRNWKPGEDPKSLEWSMFWKTQPLSYRLPVRMDGMYQEFLKQQVGTVEKINAQAKTKYKSLTEVRLGRTAPQNPKVAEWWLTFVQKKVPFACLDLSVGEPSFRSWLQQKYAGDIRRLNQRYAAQYARFEEVPLARQRPERSETAADWSEFITTASKPEDLRLDTVETRWADWLRATYQDDLAALNRAYALNAQSFDQVPLPYAESDRLFVEQEKTWMRFKYLGANYATVIAHLVTHGRAFLNTFILCAAMVLTQLTVNPFCAYALSRFPLRYKFKIILFLIATMTFPAEVLMIPNFLALKEFSLLNTYWALILPGLANGYFIFIMKGFFDGLPRELFEAAQLEGAGELRMFFQIAYPLSKPIFAVKALAAFSAAYGGFIWAFLVCQDPNMWTIMVHLYEFQIGQPSHLVMAALAISSIPTLLVFLFCQNIIMRGIVLPTMK